MLLLWEQNNVSQLIFCLQKSNKRTYYCPWKGRSVCVSVQIHIYIFIQTHIKRIPHCSENSGDLNDFYSILCIFPCLLRGILSPKLVNRNGNRRGPACLLFAILIIYIHAKRDLLYTHIYTLYRLLSLLCLVRIVHRTFNVALILSASFSFFLPIS